MIEVKKTDLSTRSSDPAKKVEVEPKSTEIDFSGKNSGSVDNSDVTLFDDSQSNAPDNSSILFITPEKRAQVAAEHEKEMAAEEAKKMDALTECNQIIGDTTEIRLNEKEYFESLAKGGPILDTDKTGMALDVRLQKKYPDATPEQFKEIKENIMLGNNMEDESKVPETLRYSKIMPTKDGPVYYAGAYKDGEEAYYDNYKKSIGTYRIEVSEGDNLSQIAKKIYNTKNPEVIKAVAEQNNLKNPNALKIGQNLILSPVITTKNNTTYYANSGEGVDRNSADFKPIIENAIREMRTEQCPTEE